MAATAPETFASSTKSFKKALLALFPWGVPIACCTAVNLPSRI
jgi:hypothetical protein